MRSLKYSVVHRHKGGGESLAVKMEVAITIQKAICKLFSSERVYVACIVIRGFGCALRVRNVIIEYNRFVLRKEQLV